ncbi:MAG: phosphate ABC transporter permease PstA [Gemmataceae bacterium]|nr:phosphate ABC transporter permease PstA [Gemmataceae bacterium]
MATAPPPDAGQVPDPFEGIDLADLEKSLFRPRNLFGGILTTLMFVFTIVALYPLFSVLMTVIVRGGREISMALFTELPPAAFEEGGGIGNAIVGTLIMVGLASLISVPVGIFAGIFLAEVGPESRLATFVRFSAKVLTGFPSVLAGVFAYGAVVLLTGGFSAVAGAIALSILIIPMVLLTSEEAIRMVPSRMREAAIGMGCTQAQVVRSVLLPTAFPGILTGIMLAVARAAGETAPLLFTALFSNNFVGYTSLLPVVVALVAMCVLMAMSALLPWQPRLRMLLNLGVVAAAVAGAYFFVAAFEFMEPTASLAVLIYNFSASPFENQVRMAWAAALVLVVVVLITNVVAQGLSPKQVRR